MCNSMLKATTASTYDSAKKELDDFISEESRHDFLSSWILGGMNGGDSFSVPLHNPMLHG